MTRTYHQDEWLLLACVYMTVFSLYHSNLSYGEEDSQIPSVVLSRAKRVIGGNAIEEGERPYLAHLEGKVPVTFVFGFPVFYRKHYCSGSLVDKQWIMTAAHCFEQMNYEPQTATPNYWHITVGEVDTDHDILDSAKHIAGRITGQSDWLHWRLHAQQIIIHPHYNERDHWLNDIALVKLEHELPLDDDPDIAPVQLPAQGEEIWPEPTSVCIMNGWGCTQGGGDVEDEARAVGLPIVENRECRVSYGLQFDTDSRLCAGYNLQNKGICKGDSGGPLVCRRGDGFEDEWIQAGIASFTSASDPGEIPGVFTRVSKYTDWIRNVIRDN